LMIDYNLLASLVTDYSKLTSSSFSFN
jgi:hypothetical protein